MLFNSVDFAVFLPVVFLLYWFVFGRSLRWQNAFVLVASYFFYGYWDARFLLLIAFSSLVDFLIGQGIGNTEKRSSKRAFLGISLFVNLGLLAAFKYHGFFLENFVTAFRFFGREIEAPSLEWILPVGISFYTFQTLSYTIDVYRGKLAPSKDPIAFFSYVSFFPQLVAGPIERATHLLPQFTRARVFAYRAAVDGFRQILWGLFLKVVIADGCAVYANRIFAEADKFEGATLAVGTILFAFQIYGDFAGYSNMAIGTSRLFGFDLRQNFAYPYFSRDIAEFWRRWHISLSTWFRDYLYIPLGGSRGGKWRSLRNVFIVFLVSGFWHGANWTFVVWGAVHALLFVPLLLGKRNRHHLDTIAEDRSLPSLGELVSMLLTFSLVCLAWVFFRAETFAEAWRYLTRLFTTSWLDLAPEIIIGHWTLWAALVFFLLVEWSGRRTPHALAEFGLNWPRPLRWLFYYALALYSIYCTGESQEFIYFQF